MKILMLYLLVVAFTASSVNATPPTVPSKPIGRILADAVRDIHSYFNNLMPIQRAIVLQRLGVPLDELSPESITEESAFQNAVLQSLMDSRNTDIIETIKYAAKNDVGYGRIDGRVNDPYMATYLPNIANLSAEDVLASLQDKTGTSSSGNYFYVTSEPKVSGYFYLPSEKKVNFNLEALIAKLNRVLGDSGRRDILEDLNRFNLKTIRKLIYDVSFAWSAWLQQNYSELREKLPTTVIRVRKFGDSYKSPKEIDDDDKSSYAESYSNDKINQQYRSLGYFVTKMIGKKDKVAIALRDDLTIFTMLALDRFYYMLMSSLTWQSPNPYDLQNEGVISAEAGSFMQDHFISILDEELQKVLTDS